MTPANILQARSDLGLTQAQLAPLLGYADGLLGGDDAQLLAAINDPDLGCSDPLVDTSLIHESAPVGAVEVVVGAYRLPPVRF